MQATTQSFLRYKYNIYESDLNYKFWYVNFVFKIWKSKSVP